MRKRVGCYGWTIALTLVSTALISVVPRAPIGFLLLTVLGVAFRWRLCPALVSVGVLTVAALQYADPVRVTSVSVAGLAIAFVIEALHRTRARERAALIRQQTSEHRFTTLFHASP